LPERRRVSLDAPRPRTGIQNHTPAWRRGTTPEFVCWSPCLEWWGQFRFKSA